MGGNIVNTSEIHCGGSCTESPNNDAYISFEGNASLENKGTSSHPWRIINNGSIVGLDGISNDYITCTDNGIWTGSCSNPPPAKSCKCTTVAEP
jgi:hypothetical protein